MCVCACAGERSLKPTHQRLDLSTTLKEEKPDHPFWATQPIVKMKDNVVQGADTASEAIEVPLDCGAGDFYDLTSIDQVKTVADVRPTPLDLPPGFEWVEVSVFTGRILPLSHRFCRTG